MSWIDVTTAVGTASAAVIALGLGLRAEWRATRIERKRDQYQERQQAVHVAAWILTERDQGTEQSDGSSAIIQNASNEPVWDIFARVPILVPDENEEWSQSGQHIIFVDILAPNEICKNSLTKLRLDLPPYLDRSPIELQFRDNAHTAWCRDKRGRLHRLGSSRADRSLDDLEEEIESEGKAVGSRSWFVELLISHHRRYALRR